MYSIIHARIRTLNGRQMATLFLNSPPPPREVYIHCVCVCVYTNITDGREEEIGLLFRNGDETCAIGPGDEVFVH